MGKRKPKPCAECRKRDRIIKRLLKVISELEDDTYAMAHKAGNALTANGVEKWVKAKRG